MLRRGHCTLREIGDAGLAPEARGCARLVAKAPNQPCFFLLDALPLAPSMQAASACSVYCMAVQFNGL
ncbi:hypothetical protein XCR_1785 [Xanthomonas campestris pv. raphani 756C]|nr:hypothetical protein XCR_1785 [Xanthomonas campestris pv. raphani 756C]